MGYLGLTGSRMRKRFRKQSVARILRDLKATRQFLDTDSERKAWRAVWNSTIDLARALDVLDMISEETLRVSWK